MKAKPEQEKTKELLKKQKELKGKTQKNFKKQKIQKLSFDVDEENEELNDDNFQAVDPPNIMIKKWQT